MALGSLTSIPNSQDLGLAATFEKIGMEVWISSDLDFFFLLAMIWPSYAIIADMCVAERHSNAGTRLWQPFSQQRSSQCTKPLP
jgi:hypothetical protein